LVVMNQVLGRAWRAGLRFLARAGVLAVAACASPPERPTEAVNDEGPQSVAGAFLAGRYARTQNDTGAAARFFDFALRSEPDDALILQRGFSALLADGRIPDALAHAEAVAQANPRSGTANLLSAVDLARQGRFELALQRLNVAGNADQIGLLRPLVTAWALAGRGDADGAIKALATLADRGGLAGFRNYHAGLIGEYFGRRQDAEAALRAVVGAEGGRNLRSIEALGGLLERSGQKDEASSLYRGYLERLPEHAGAEFLLRRAEGGRAPTLMAGNPVQGMAEAFYNAAAALVQENVREAPEIYVQVALYLVPDHPAALALLGDLRENQDRFAEARATFQRVPRDSAYSWLTRLRAAALLDKLEKFDDASHELRVMMAERPDRSDPASLLGDLLRGRERFAEAVGAYDMAVERIAGRIAERHWTLFYARGVASERAKNWPRAEADFTRALELRPDQPLVLNYLGYSWVEQGVNIERAKRMIERAVAQRPNDGYIVDSLGWVLYRLGDFAGAVPHLEKAVELRPGDPTINDHLGDAYWAVGRKSEARFQWRRALGLSPDVDQVPRIEEKLKVNVEEPRRHFDAGS